MTSEDSRLVARFLAGDQEVASMVAAWVKVSTLSFRQRLGSDWEDAHQEAITELTQALRANRYRGESSLRAYARAVANSTCLDRLRFRRRWQWTELDEERLPLSRESAERTAERLDLRELVQRVLAAVPEECRRLWALVTLGRSYREMSHELSIAEGTIRVKVLRCRRRALQIRDEVGRNVPPAETP